MIPGVGSAVVFAWLVQEKRRAANPQMHFWASVRSLPAGFRRFLWGVGVFGMGDFSPTLLILAATQLLAPTYGIVDAAQVAALFYALRNAIYAAASYPIGALSDRGGRRGLLALGYGVGGLVAAGTAAIFLQADVGHIFLAILFVLSGVSAAAVDALEGALSADLLPQESTRGTAYGVLGSVNGVGDLISSAAVGFLWWGINPAAGFAYAAVLMFAGAALLYRVR